MRQHWLDGIRPSEAATRWRSAGSGLGAVLVLALLLTACGTSTSVSTTTTTQTPEKSFLNQVKGRAHFAGMPATVLLNAGKEACIDLPRGPMQAYNGLSVGEIAQTDILSAEGLTYDTLINAFATGTPYDPSRPSGPTPVTDADAMFVVGVASRTLCPTGAAAVRIYIENHGTAGVILPSTTTTAPPTSTPSAQVYVPNASGTPQQVVAAIDAAGLVGQIEPDTAQANGIPPFGGCTPPGQPQQSGFTPSGAIIGISPSPTTVVHRGSTVHVFVCP